MANKRVPEEIGGVVLHQRACARTNQLLRDLEDSAGVRGLSAAESQIDRIRLIASRLFELVERTPVTNLASQAEEVTVPTFVDIT